jgi:hypothetical protein
MERLLEPLTGAEQLKFLDGFELLLTRHQEQQPNSNGKGYHENKEI